MTELICTLSEKARSRYVMEKIKERLEKDEKLCLIVPEQQSVLWETKICRELPPSAALKLEVVSFKRLANAVARQVGGLSYNYMGEGRRLLLMWSAIASVKEKLSVYSGGEDREDKYTSLMLTTAGELRKNRISAAALDKAASELDSKEHESLSKRLSDVALIYSAYSALSESDETEDPENILDNLEKTLRTSDFFKGTSVFIDSFYSLTPVEAEILYHIIRTADNTYVTFSCLPESDDVHFEHIRKYYRMTRRSAEVSGKDVKTVRIENGEGEKKESLSYLEKNLWSFSAKPVRSDGSVKIISCADRYEEARAVGAEIERLVNEGAAYSDIAVISRDTATLTGILDSRLDSLKIPYHAAKRKEISTSPAVRLVTGLLDTVHSGYKREKLISCIKTGLCPVTARECANFEEYTATWNIRGRKGFLDGELWSMNPAGYVKDMSEWGKTVLADACKVKGIMAEPLLKLDRLFDGGKAPVIEICKEIYGILCDFDVYSSLMLRADKLRKNERDREASECEKLFSVILDVLDTMAETVGAAFVDAGKFSRLFLQVAKTFDIGSIPEGVDAVIWGSAKGIRAGEIKHVILTGCIDGEFPMSVKDTDFFTDADKIALEGVGLNMGDDTGAKTAEELFRFWRAVTMASESVTLIAPASDAGRKTSLSIGARQIKRLLSLEIIPFFEIAKRDVIWSEHSAADTLPYLAGTKQYKTVLSLGETYPEILRKRGLTGELGAENEFVSKEVTDKLWGSRISLTQSRIDSFSSCRFAYYMNYVLKLGEIKRASVGTVDVGNLVHRILEVFFFETRGRTFPLEREETEEIADRIIEKHIEEIMGGLPLSSRQHYLISRLRRNVLVILDMLMREFAESSFAPWRFELSMNGGSEDCPVPLTFETEDKTKVSLYGVIDRVDTYSTDGCVFVRVVDYKTGSKTFKRSDIEKGKNLQLLIYLFTLWKGEACPFRETLSEGGMKKIVPAGMLYFSASPDSAKSDKYITAEEGVSLAGDSIVRSGLFLNDEDILKAMDPTPEGRFIPYKNRYGKADPKKLCTVEEFDTLFEETKSVIRNIADSMKSGACPSVPSETGQNSPCRYCKLKPVCRHIEGKEDR